LFKIVRTRMPKVEELSQGTWSWREDDEWLCDPHAPTLSVFTEYQFEEKKLQK